MARTRKKAFYAAPGADDTFLRPKLGQGFAPRQIAVLAEDDGLRMAWVHRDHGRDEIVATKRKPGRKSRLEGVPVPGERFSKPELVRDAEGQTHLFVASGPGKRWAVREYVKKGAAWQCVKRLPTSCSAIYEVKCIATPDGGMTLAWSGVVPGQSGLRVFTRQWREGRWSDERAHPMGKASVTRPALAVDGAGDVILAADIYRGGQFGIVTKRLTHKRASAWKRVDDGEGWNMFPAMTRDAAGDVWLTWLHQTLVRREDVVAHRQEAYAAVLRDGKWTPVKDRGNAMLANMNHGLLPIKRYFGYDGLRRYPRPLATRDEAVWLVWEQQRGEGETWGQVDDGYLCGRRFKDGRWAKPAILLDAGTCYAFDRRCVYEADTAFVARKGARVHKGNDFEPVAADLVAPPKYQGPPARSWSGWREHEAQGPAKGRPSVSSAGERLKLYWGDLHAHSMFSPDAEGEPDELYAFARDLAGIDFVCLADNDFYPNTALLDSELHFAAALADGLTTPRFLAMLGYEWTFHRPDAARTFNHRIVVFPPTSREAARRSEPAGATEDAMRDYLDRTGYFAFPHHAYWTLLGGRGERTVEVTAAWGTYILDATTVADALNAGERFGFLGNSDSHRFIPGLGGALTGVYARDLRHASVMDALKRRRCLATTGNRTALEFRVDDCLMGGEVTCDRAPRLRWRVRPQDRLERIDIIRDGEVVHTARTETGTWTDDTAAPGAHWYYLQAREPGKHKEYPHNVAPAWGKYAWTSPVWVTRA